MTQTVTVPGLKQKMEFPDEATPEQIELAIKERFPAHFDGTFPGSLDLSANDPGILGSVWGAAKEWGTGEFEATTEGIKHFLPKPVEPPKDPVTGQPIPYDPARDGPLPGPLEQIGGAGRKLMGGAGQALINSFLELPTYVADAVSPPVEVTPADPENPTFSEVLAALQQVPRHVARELAERGTGAMKPLKAPLPNEEYLSRLERGVQSGSASLGHMATDIGLGGPKHALKLMFTDVTADATRELKDKGYSDAGALIIGSLHGGAELVGEKTALGVLFKKWGGNWKKELVKFIALETGQETITEGLQAWIDKMTTDQDMTWGEFKERYYDMLASLPFSLGGLTVGRKSVEGLANLAEGRPSGVTKKGRQAAALGDEINRAVEETELVGGPVKVGAVTEAFEEAEAPKAEPKTEETTHVPPVGAKTQDFIDIALRTAGYQSIDEVPDNVRERIYRDAEDLHEQSLVQEDSSDIAFELRNLVLEEQRKRGKVEPSQQAQPATITEQFAVNDKVQLNVEGAKNPNLGEQGQSTRVAGTIVADTGKGEAIMLLDEDVPAFGAKAGERIKINTESGQMLSGFGSGPAAAARTGYIQPHAVEEPTTTQFARKKKPKPKITPKAQSTEDWIRDYDLQKEKEREEAAGIYDAYDDAYDAIDAGKMTLDEAATMLAERTGLPKDDFLADLKFDYGDDFTKVEEPALIDNEDDELAREMSQAERDYYRDIFDDYFPDSTKDYKPSKKSTTSTTGWNDYRHGRWWNDGPMWALDDHLSDNATGEIIEGSAETLMPDILPALRGETITDPNMAAPMSPREQNAIARVLRKMVDAGFPRAVIRSISSYGKQREKKYIGVSGAYSGIDHSVRYADYVLDDLRYHRQNHTYQKAMRFLTSHELSHAIESDRNEHTLSMDSPLFHLDMEVVKVKEEEETYTYKDRRTGKEITNTRTKRTPMVDLKKAGKIIAELIEVYDSNSPLSSILGYPFMSLSSLTSIKDENEQRAEINRIRAEAFAQLGAIYYTYPELAKEYLPKGSAFMEEITNAANHESRSARRRALRVPFQIEGTRRSDANIWSEAAGDIKEGRGPRQRDKGTTQYRQQRPDRVRQQNRRVLNSRAKRAIVQRVVDRVKASSAHKDFDLRVLDNPHNPDLPAQIYKDILAKYQAGDQYAFQVPGLHNESYGRPIMFIFSDNIDSQNFELDLVRTILHEGLSGHFVLRQYFGSGSEEYANFMDSVYELYKNETAFKDLMHELKLDRSSVYGRRMAAEEFLAEMTEEAGSLYADIASVWDKLVHILKKILRSIFRKANLNLDVVEKISTRDVKAILSKARRRVHGEGYSANYERGMREVMDAGGTMAARRKFYTDLYEYVEVEDEHQYITDRQEVLPFYSQLHARAAVDAPQKGTPDKYKKWLETAKKSGEKTVVNIDPALRFIEEEHARFLSDLMANPNMQYNKKLTSLEVSREGEIIEAKPPEEEVWKLSKKQIVKHIDHGKFKGYIQANAPSSLPISDWTRYLKHAQRAFRGGPVKGEEIEWTGVTEFLDSIPKDEEITRAEFASWINAHKILLRDTYAAASQFGTLFSAEGIEEYVQEVHQNDDVEFVYSHRVEPNDSDIEYYTDDYYETYEQETKEKARDNVDRDDYIDDEGNFDEEGYDEAVEDEVQEALSNLRDRASDVGYTRAAGYADDIYVSRNTVYQWEIHGNSAREWRIIDNDGLTFNSGYSNWGDAVFDAIEEIRNRDQAEGEEWTSQSLPSSIQHRLPGWVGYSTSSENYRELLFTIPSEFVEDDFAYRIHYGDPNILVYVRLSDVTWVVNGERKRALNIEEMQSDWNQIGELTGYGEEQSKQRVNELQQKYEALREKHREFLPGDSTPYQPITEYTARDIVLKIAKRILAEGSMETIFGKTYKPDSEGYIEIQLPLKTRDAYFDEPNDQMWDQAWVNLNRLADPTKDVSERTLRGMVALFSENKHAQAWAKIEYKQSVDGVFSPVFVESNKSPYIEQIREVQRKINLAKDFVPDVPFKQVYTSIAFKRLARLAVDENYDALTVTPGEVHSGPGRWGSDVYVWTNKDKAPDDVVDAQTRISELIEKRGYYERSIAQRTRQYKADVGSLEEFYDRAIEPVLRGDYQIQDFGLRDEPERYYYHPIKKQWTKKKPAITEAERIQFTNYVHNRSKQIRETYRQEIKPWKRSIKSIDESIVKNQKIVDNWKGATLPDGVFYFASRLQSNELLGSSDVTKLRKEDYWSPSDDRKQELIKSISPNQLIKIDTNTPEGLEKLRDQLSSTLRYAQHYGHMGSLTQHTVDALMPTLLKQMTENPSHGMIFRRGAGLSSFYDRKLLNKNEGIKSLTKNMKVGQYEAYGIEMAGVLIDDEFKQKWGVTQTQFARPRRQRKSDDKRKILAKVGKTGTAATRFAELFKTPAQAYKHARDWFIQKTLNIGLPFRRMTEQMGIPPTEEDPYVAWRLMAGDSAMIEDWLGINPGTEGTVPFDVRSRLRGSWGKSLREILDPVLVDRETFMDFEEYIIARHAAELMSIGKERLYTQDEIDYGLGLQRPEFDTVAQQLYNYNNELVQFAVDGGFLSEEAAVRIKRYAYYIPFFREAEHEGDVGGKRRGSIFKRLTGGKQHLRDPIQNIIDNTASIIHAVNRNAALAKALAFAESRPDGKRWMERVKLPMQAVKLSTDRIVEALDKQGVKMDLNSAEEISYMQTFFQNKPIGDEKNRIVIIKVEGKPTAIKVHDKAIWDALHAMAPMEFGLLIDVLSIPAETIKTGIVLDPGFMGANLSRDTVSGFIQARPGQNLWPVVNSMQGMKDVATSKEIYKLYRALGGGYADMWHGDSKEAHHTIKRLAKVGRFRPGTVLNPMTYWRLLRKLGTITESGTRLKAFEKIYKLDPDDPGNALLAALEGREISVDFSLHGTSKTLRALERMTPFLNPAKQGIYKMGRVVGDQPLLTAMRGAPLLLLTYYLWMQNRDDEWYNDLEDWEKNHYWHADIGIRSSEGDVIPVRLPKPFEYGALFGSFAEALFQYIYDRDGEEAVQRVGSTIEDVFLLRGYPTSLALPTELYFNENLFTDRPIVPAYMEGIDPTYQYGPYTSMFARETGEALGLSPFKIDHTVRGIFGTLGVYALMAIDDPLIKLTGEVPKPSRHWWQMPGMRRFFSDPLRPNGKAMTEFYDTMNQYRMEQKTWEFLDYSQDYLDTLENNESFSKDAEESVSKLMTTIRKSSREIRDSDKHTAEEKRQMINNNTRKLRYISRQWKKKREAARGASSKDNRN